MAGLGLGYLVGGVVSDRAPQNKPILYFVYAEIGIGLFAVLSKFILYDFLHNFEWARSTSIFQTYLILFSLLVFPTFLMGLSLPLLSNAFQLNNLKNQSKFIAKLYFVNTLGAGLGALTTGLLLIGFIGLHYSVLLGATINFLCALLGALTYLSEKNKHKEKEEKKSTLPFQWNVRFSFWTVQYFISGFMAICFEIIWFRILDVTIKSISMTFAIVLFIYLISMAMGTNYGVRYLQKPRKFLPATFLKIQYFLYAYTVGVIMLLLYAVFYMDSLSFLLNYFYGYESSFQAHILLTVYIVLPMLLMFLPTFLMGLSFSISQAIIQDDFSEVGRKVGWLQCVNIFGSLLGAWFVSIIGFNHLGSSWTIKLLGCIGIFYLALLLYKKYLRPVLSGVLALLLIGFIYFIPDQKTFWQILAGVKEAEKIILKEDETAVSAIKIHPHNSDEAVVYVNGLGQSLLPFHRDDVHIALGSLPTLLHPNPEDIAIIGLGSGSTLYSMAGRLETKKLDCFEVAKGQPDALLDYALQQQDSNVQAILSDPRVNLILKDGRYEIKNNSKKYDIIEADALRPRSAYSGNIYSKEFFEILRSKLKKGGIVVSWIPTSRVKDTFLGVFKYVYQIEGFLLIGSEIPFDINKEEVLERLNTDFTKTHYAKAEIDIEKIVNLHVENITNIQQDKITSKEDINTDMFPKDEYMQNFKGLWQEVKLKWLNKF